MATLTINNIGLQGQKVGTYRTVKKKISKPIISYVNMRQLSIIFFKFKGNLMFRGDKIEWKDKSNTTLAEYPKNDIKEMSWKVFGSKASMKIVLNDEKTVRLDGFTKNDKGPVSKFVTDNYAFEVTNEKLTSEGANYGALTVVNKTLSMKSVNTDSTLFDIKLDTVAQCVVPPTNQNELEIQFIEESVDRDDDCLCQITFHFPEGEEEPLSEQFRKTIMKTGVIRSATGVKMFIRSN